MQNAKQERFLGTRLPSVTVIKRDKEGDGFHAPDMSSQAGEARPSAAPAWEGGHRAPGLPAGGAREQPPCRYRAEEAEEGNQFAIPPRGGSSSEH